MKASTYLEDHAEDAKEALYIAFGRGAITARSIDMLKLSINAWLQILGSVGSSFATYKDIPEGCIYLPKGAWGKVVNKGKIVARYVTLAPRGYGRVFISWGRYNGTSKPIKFKAWIR